jgi:leader peptidase (prepilin peptidase) / N-methyltransferase
LLQRGEREEDPALTSIPPASLWPVLVAPFIGSFLGVLVARLPRDEPFIWGRSGCDHCGHNLGVLDLVPILSWSLARGRCRYCGAGVTALYTGIELGAIALALWAATITEGPLLWASCLLGWCLLTLAVIDARDGLLPDALTLPLLLLGLAFAAVGGTEAVEARVIGAAIGFLSFALIRWAYRRWRGRDGLGFGDVKLMAAAGAWVSWDGLPSVVLIGALFGLALALLGPVLGRRLALDQRLAFGPGLCLGTWLVWLYGPLG